MTLATQIRIQDTPVWNEVKSWSIDDKRNLIALLYDTMVEEEQDCNVKESAEEAFADQLSKDLLSRLGEYALQESRAGRCIPHAQAMEMIKERMGFLEHYSKE